MGYSRAIQNKSIFLFRTNGKTEKTEKFGPKIRFYKWNLDIVQPSQSFLEIEFL